MRCLAMVMTVLGMGLLAPVAHAELEGIHKIQHVVVIMQENRSFDSYFGTYPGADGIPAGVCDRTRSVVVSPPTTMAQT